MAVAFFTTLVVGLGGCSAASHGSKTVSGPAMEPPPPAVASVKLPASVPGQPVPGAAVMVDAAPATSASMTASAGSGSVLATSGPGALTPTADETKLVLLAQATTSAAPPSDDADDLYDPWEPFNETMFDFNVKLDRYVLKPTARVYRAIVPEPFQIMISNGFDNTRWVPRFVNNLLQRKFGGAGRELARFLINSTAGIGGLFDPAKDFWGIHKSREDFGQTLGAWGASPGPYLVLPVLAPTTVRDGIGMGVDLLLDPLGYFVPLLPARLAMKAGDIVNDRALNYDLFQGVEETTIDLYSSVRHFYLKRREQQIKE